MFLIDIDEIKNLFLSCFNGKETWYERCLVCLVVFFALLLICLLPYGFVLPLFVLPYFLIVKKTVLLSNCYQRKISWKKLLLSARRYGRSFCIIATKVLCGILLVPLLSFVFTGYVQCECEELDYKGVLMLSRELVKGCRGKIFMFLLFLVCLSVFSFATVLGVVIILKTTCNLSSQAQIILMLLGGLILLIFVILPLWEKYIENLYLRRKSGKIEER